MSRLGKVEIIPGRVVRAVARERPIARALHNFDIGIFLRNLLPGLFQALAFDAEMVKPCFAPCSPRDERHPDIPVPDGDCIHLAYRVARRLQPEHCTVEHSEQRIAIARNGQMIELPNISLSQAAPRQSIDELRKVRHHDQFQVNITLDVT